MNAPRMDPSVARRRKPEFTRVLNESLYHHPEADVEITVELLFPIPVAKVGERVINRLPLQPWEEWDSNPALANSPLSYDTLGGEGLVVCKPELLTVRNNVIRCVYNDPKARDRIEQRIRHQIFTHVVDLYPLYMNVTPATAWPWGEGWLS